MNLADAGRPRQDAGKKPKLMFPAATGLAIRVERAADRAGAGAFYLMVTEFDLTMTAVAKIAGVTKQAVSKSLRDIEDEREKPALDALLSRVARHVSGRAG